MKALTKSVLFIAVIVLSACSKHECHNTNTVFETQKPESAAYKEELMKQLQSRDSFTFILTKYEEVASLPFFHVDIHGKNICAKAVIAVNVPDDTALTIIKSKGTGYYGGEIEDLSFTFNKDKNMLIYQSATYIID